MGSITRGAALAMMAMLAACAEPRLRQNLVVLIPDEQGKVGALELEQQGHPPTRLETAYAAAQVGRTGQLERVEVSEQEARQIFAAALRAQPRLPARFVLYFRQGSDELTPESTRDFEAVFLDVRERPYLEMEVIGHTDSRGTADVNQRLSERRAEAIARLVAQRGLATDRITTTGRGEADLLVPTLDEVDEARNRRVEIVVR
jgi:outer membrane protein OmpA-like peptidoglycan-associated protein